jgi:hypothetical protein
VRGKPGRVTSLAVSSHQRSVSERLMSRISRGFAVFSAGPTPHTPLDGASVDTLSEGIGVASQYVTAWRDRRRARLLGDLRLSNHGDPWLEQRYQGD